MMTRTDWTPLVIFGILLLATACFLGMVLSGVELVDPSRAKQEAVSKATYDELSAEATRVAVQATATAVAGEQNREAMEKYIEEAPLRQKQAEIQMQEAQAANNIKATVTAQENEAKLKDENLKSVITANQLEAERQANQNRFEMVSQYAIVAAILVVAVFLAFLSIQLGLLMRATAIQREREAEANLLAQKRLSEQARAVISALPTRPVPTNGKVKEAPVTKEPAGWPQKTPDYSKIK